MRGEDWEKVWDVRKEALARVLGPVGDGFHAPHPFDFGGFADVLTFPLETDSGGHTISGEIVVCVPEARRRARERGIPLEREVLLYALHGMLHLIGYDDRTDAGFAKMHRIEDDILTALGVGPVFRAPNRSRRARSGAK